MLSTRPLACLVTGFRNVRDTILVDAYPTHWLSLTMFCRVTFRGW